MRPIYIYLREQKLPFNIFSTLRNQISNLSEYSTMNKTTSYGIFGACFGACFPLLSWLFDIYVQGESGFSFASIAHVHDINKLHYVIDTAPIFLALAFGIAGNKQDTVLAINQNLDKKVEAKTLELVEKNVYLQETHEELKQNLEEIMAIQEQLETQKKAAEKFSLFQQAILDHATCMIIATDTEGTITSFNKACEQQLGYKACDLVGKASPAAFHDLNEVVAYAPVLSQELGREIPIGFEVFVAKTKDGLPNTKEWTYMSKTGKRFPVELNVSAIRNAKGNITGYLGVATDISDRKEAEAQIEEYTSQLETNVEEISTTLELVNKQKNEIHAKNVAITSSITYAKRIQTAILPKMSSIARAIPENFVLFRPKDIVSGDFYYFANKGDKVIFAAVDCTGHGVPGAFMSLIGKNLLDQIVHDKEIYQPDLILNELHKGIRLALKQEDKSTADGMDLAIVCLNKTNNTLEFAGAKNPLLYIQDGELVHIKGDKMCIGGEQKEAERIFTLHSIPLEGKETSFYLFTDGYQDQFGGDKSRKFGLAQIKQLLLDNQDKSFLHQSEILDETLEQWKITGKEKQIDDVLFIGGKIAS
jgi:PAS domain S-box-containing protein